MAYHHHHHFTDLTQDDDVSNHRQYVYVVDFCLKQKKFANKIDRAHFFLLQSKLNPIIKKKRNCSRSIICLVCTFETNHQTIVVSIFITTTTLFTEAYYCCCLVYQLQNIHSISFCFVLFLCNHIDIHSIDRFIRG